MFGFCAGMAGLPPAARISQAFALGAPGGDFRSQFVVAIDKKYGNVRYDASCRMFQSAAEAIEAHRRYLEESRKYPGPFTELNWTPKGATALTPETPEGAKVSKPDSAH
jgi:hypothetical protein